MSDYGPRLRSARRKIMRSNSPGCLRKEGREEGKKGSKT